MKSIEEMSLTRQLRRYDKNLYAERNYNGTMCIWSKHKEMQFFDLDQETKLGVVKDGRYLVMALTDTWGVRGKPIPWGVEVVLNRLKANDLSKNENIFKDLDVLDEKLEESKQRDLSNSIESFLYDYRCEFKKTFNDVNTSNLK